MKIQILKFKRNRLFKKPSAQLRQRSYIDSSLAVEAADSKSVSEKIRAINSDIQALAARTYFWTTRPLLTGSLVLVLTLVFAGVACQKQTSAQDLPTPKKAVQAFDDAMMRNDLELAHSLARGDEAQFATAKVGIHLAHLVHRFAVAEAKRFRPTDKTGDYAETWEKATEHLEGNKATVDAFLGPSFALERIGETWRIDLGSSPRLTAFKAADTEKITGALNAITEKLESGQFKTKAEFESEFDTKVHPLTANAQKEKQAAIAAATPDSQTIGTTGQSIAETPPSSAAAAGGYEATPTAPTQVAHVESTPAAESSPAAASQPSETGAGQLPEYTVAEATKHIGENATVLVRVDCIECVTGCYLSFGDCGGDATFFIHLPENPTGPRLDVDKLKGMTIAVSGTIKHQVGGGLPFIDVQSTSQIALPKQSTSGELERTIAQKGKALEANPRDATAYYQRGMAEEKQAALHPSAHDYRAAIDDYNQCVKLDPSNSDALVHIGDCYAAQQDYQAAKQAWDKAIEVSPQAKELLKDSIAKEQARYAYAAIHDLDKLTDMEPKNAALYYHKAELYMMDQSTDNANANFKKAAELEPTNVVYADKSAHPLAPAKRQLTVEEMKDAVIGGIVTLGTAALGTALLSDIQQHNTLSHDNNSSRTNDSSNEGWKRVRCPKCKGSGFVFEAATTITGERIPGSIPRELKCDECNGKGFVEQRGIQTRWIRD